MLHIILVILKIIGWLLLAILGLLVLLVFVVLFTAVKIRIEGDCQGDLDSLQAQIRFSWLFRLLSGQVTFEGRKLQWKVRILWKRLPAAAQETEGTQKRSRKKEKQLETMDPQEGNLPEVSPPETKPPEIEAAEAQTEMQKVESAELPAAMQVEPVLTEKKEAGKKKRNAEKKPKEKKTSFAEKIQQLFQKIKYTFTRFCDKIKSLLVKKEHLQEFLSDEVHQAAFSHLWAELKKLVKRLRPKKWDVDVRFGFEDPSKTGQLLAVTSMLYPWVDRHMKVQAEFEEEVLEGHVFLKERIRPIIFVILLWNLLWDKNARTTVRHIMKLKQ